MREEQKRSSSPLSADRRRSRSRSRSARRAQRRSSRSRSASSSQRRASRSRRSRSSDRSTRTRKVQREDSRSASNDVRGDDSRAKRVKSDRRRRSRSRSRSRTRSKHKRSRSASLSSSSASSSSDESSSSDSSDDERSHRKRKRSSRSSSKKSHKKKKDAKHKRKHKRKHKKSEKTHAVNQNEYGKYGIIRESDFHAKSVSFQAWLRDIKKMSDFNGPKWEAMELFKEYMEDFNTATLPHEKYYDIERYELLEHKKQQHKSARRAERSALADEERVRLERQQARLKKEQEDFRLILQHMDKDKIEDMRHQEELRAQMRMHYKAGNVTEARRLEQLLNKVDDVKR